MDEAKTLYKFQFHKGSIKSCMYYIFESLFFRFNSIKVRLKELVEQSYFDTIAFQFHKGSIKRPQ